ncbi:MAG: hypothetical protein KKE39_09020 [Bacteroidetes bacterium]|nr:hypothetical protein [Bacteroidota bacterium]MBU1371911.1 hypothetical protein [Bacteroidota bacterium]MBU1483513.1 hypothetical protein [Bacteroidota bacterium]MBU1761041.1 hypothetical protein [Bacteroidota bacterium]MBU2045106.1 hypothetical protein [Bacteroidota bacterium]
MKNLIFFFLILSSNLLFGQKLQDSDIDECSGLVVSSKKDNLLWVHNDSGDKSRVFLIDNQGETQAVFNFNKEVIDCEDIAMNYPKNGKPQLFVGDIGDNSARREYISIYKFDEPNLAIKSKDEIAVKNVEELRFKYPDGPRDAECLMIDQHDQKIYIVSKREDHVGLYSAPLNSKQGNIIILKKEMTLTFPGGPGSKWITAGDISRDGKEVVIKSYIFIFYWDRKLNETIPQCLKRAFDGLPYNPEKQGEAVGLTKDGRSYYTISEGKHADINFKKI